jgi:ERCC4-related helicase
LKSHRKNGILHGEELATVNSLIEACGIKSRLEKIQDLVDFNKEHGRNPRINSDSESERKLAMFMNNIKQANSNGKLNEAERKLLLTVVKRKPKVTT